MSKPLGQTHKAAWVAFFVAHGLITRKIDERLRKAGLVSLDVYDVLLVLEEAPDQRLRMSELASRVLLTRSGMTRMTDRLEKLGLLERRRCPKDRRVQHVVLTPAGLEARKAAWEVYRDGVAEFFANHLNEEEATGLAGSLSRIVRQIDPSYLEAGERAKTR